MKQKLMLLSALTCSSFTLYTLTSQQPFEHTDPSLQIVNKRTSLGNYEPQDLVILDYPKLACSKELLVSKRIVSDLKKLITAAKKDGLTLKVSSGYRSRIHQIATFERWVQKTLKKNPKLTRAEAEEQTNQFSALPGHSEHQLGTTVDLLSSENDYKFSADKKLKFIGWLEKNAEKFNFKISWPENNGEFIYEPWHIRWYPH